MGPPTLKSAKIPDLVATSKIGENDIKSQNWEIN